MGWIVADVGSGEANRSGMNAFAGAENAAFGALIVSEDVMRRGMIVSGQLLAMIGTLR
jgi:hypothetical protein